MIEPSIIEPIVSNLTNIATTYTTGQIMGAIQERIVFGFVKITMGILIGIGFSKVRVKEIKVLAVAIFGLFSVLGVIDLMRAIIAAITQSMP